MFDDLTRTYTVAELGARIGLVLETAFPDDVWVQGTIANLTRSRNGHVYFDLCDAADTPGQPPLATLAVTLFKMNKEVVNRLMKRAGISRMEDGMAVRIRGVVNFYAPSGRLQLRMTSVDPTHTLGTMAATRELVLRRLADAGLLELQQRHQLPSLPLRIGLVTSYDSAAYHDFVSELAKSAYGFSVTVIDAHVQGNHAEQSVCAALATLAARPLDVVAVVRGGGSRVDLAAFDSERIARAIAALGVPVLTGIGHEVDRAVADEVAHLAFKTPTACAQFLVTAAGRYLDRCEAAWGSVERRARQLLDGHARHVRDLARHAARSTRHTLQRADEKQLACAVSAASLARGAARRADRVIDQHIAVLPARAARATERGDRHLDQLAARARAHDPARVLARGFAVVRDPHGRVVHTVAQLAPGDQTATTFVDGTVASTVTRVDQSETDHDH